MRTFLAAKAKASSRFKDNILLTRVPSLTSISYWVTAGPILALTTLASTPKFLKTLVIIGTMVLTAS